MPVNRRTLLKAMLAPPLTLHAQPADAPALVVVLVDASLTIPDLKDFRKAWNTVVDRAIGGDRVVITVISGRTGNRENPSLTEIGDRELQVKGFNDNPITYAETLAVGKSMLTTDFENALAKPRPNRTELLRSIRDASRYLGAEQKRHKILVILSDMLQDSTDYHFNDTRLTDTFTKNVIARQQKEGTQPNLRGVRVYTYVPGVAAPAKADEVERFWITYLTACGATIDERMYGTLTNYRRSR